MADRLGVEKTAGALKDFDRLYPQPNGESALQQLLAQLSNAIPYDLDDTNLSEYKLLDQRWHDWRRVHRTCAEAVTGVFDAVCKQEVKNPSAPPAPDP